MDILVIAGQILFNKVLHRFKVVVDSIFYDFDPCCWNVIKVLPQFCQLRLDLFEAAIGTLWDDFIPNQV